MGQARRANLARRRRLEALSMILAPMGIIADGRVQKAMMKIDARLQATVVLTAFVHATQTRSCRSALTIMLRSGIAANWLGALRSVSWWFCIGMLERTVRLT